MTESKIFEILLQRQSDFPKLDVEAACSVANSFSDIIYDTLKLKSSLSTAKRLNVLKFLKTLATNSDSHVNVNEQNYPIFIESCLQNETDEVEEFVSNVHRELRKQLPENLCAEVLDFYKRKNGKHQKNIKQMESIKKYDQEALDKTNFSAKITRNISYYETSESIIKKLLRNNTSFNISNTQVILHDLSYRQKQVKFAYSLLYLKQWTPLKKVLNRFTKYQTLTNYEINFLYYLNENMNSDGEHLREFLIKNFIFIYEKILLELCTKIIQLEANQVLDYFETLLFEKKYLIIKQITENELYKIKVKAMLYELYSYSFCNPNLLKFLDFFLQ